MSIIGYDYEIVYINAEDKAMEVVYSAEGYPSVHIGVRLPFDDEELIDVIKMYAPLVEWEIEDKAVTVPEIGAGSVIVPPPYPGVGYVLNESNEWVFDLDIARISASLTRREFFSRLEDQHGGMYDIVRAMEDDPQVEKSIRIDLREATRFDRTWPALTQIATAHGFSEGDLDTLFGIEVPV